ncbi:hypothetical protein [Enterococcus mundtii]|uniref:hypothetical protein n=1 Tax=Enterococcus mundtii TaxID=53346 RepID=UPI001A96FB21|nr:hypothetical protein [Enterococcus mundtii]
MTAEKQKELDQLAQRTANYSPRFIFEGDYTDLEIEYYLQSRSKINKSNVL